MGDVIHFSTEYSPGTGNATAPQVKATGVTSNGLAFDFSATDLSRPAADYDWSFPGASTVDGVSATTKVDSKGPIRVVYAAAGVKTATLTVAAGAGPPAGGAYPVNVTAVAGPR
jgi:hypothetical protein